MSSSNPNQNQNQVRSGTKRKFMLFGIEIEVDDQSTARQDRDCGSGSSANHARSESEPPAPEGDSSTDSGSESAWDSESEDEDGKSLRVHVWTPNGDRIGILMSQEDPVSLLREEIESAIDIPADDQVLTYKYNRLGSEERFEEYGIEKSCTVRVTWKPYSYQTREMRKTVDSMVTAAARLCQGISDPSSKVAIRKFATHFLEGARKDGEELCRRYFDVFTSLPAAKALSRLYLSPREAHKKLGGCAIERFMAGAAKLRKGLRRYALPSVLQFCMSLRTVDPREPLYSRCRSTMRSLIDTAFHGEGNDWLLENKDIMGFECRKHLAMMMFPHLSEEDEFQTGIVDRSNLLDDSYGHIAQTDPEYIRDGVSIKFRNEEATGPGVLREWFLLVCKELFNPQNALFMANTNDHRRLYINPASKVEPSLD